ncbi:hypothetical protein C2E23DRAFT_890671 [Lenzites betulinus]|nr:hypothetical protein C2E23DRAFT_890671 [Lenzites betulinus]
MVSDVTGGVLSIAKWSLVELDIVSDWDNARVDLFPEDLLWLVKQHSATLEKLTVRRGCLTNSFEEVDNYHPHPGHMSCPHLHTLVLRHLDEFEDVTILHDAFPALRHLELSFDIDWDFYVEEMREDAAPKDGVVYPWDVLNRLCGAVDALYSLCGAYAANILEVYRIHSDKELLKRLRTVISDVQPTHLVLHTGGFDSSSQFFAKDILHLLPKEETKVTHLVLTMKASAFKGTMDAFLLALTELLRAHPVQFLILRFLKRVVYDQELAKKLEARGSRVHRQDEDEPNEIVDALNERSMPSIIERFFKADPTLAHIVVDIENEGFDYWQIQNKDDGLQTMTDIITQHQSASCETMDVDIPEPRLYYDLFLEIFRCIPRQCDVAAMMSTCKTLWIDGVKYLLAFPVVIRQPSTLRSFCTFMLNDIPFRTPLLRQFYLMISVDLGDWDSPSEDEDDRDSEPGQYPRMSQDLVSMLARVLENTTNLEDLSMESPDNLFYTIDDDPSCRRP